MEASPTRRSALVADTSPFSVLMVCTGNICRSPLAEQLLTSRLGEAGLHSVVAVSSAGLGAVVGSAMDETAAAISKGLRGRPEAFQARQLRSGMIADAGLVLTMTRAQRDDAIQRYPRVLQRIFTLTEFAKLLAITGEIDAVESDPLREDAPLTTLPHSGLSEVPAAIQQRVQELARSRSRAHLTISDDVTDPFRRSAEVHEAVGRQISLATSQIALNFVGWAIEAQASRRLDA